MKFLDVTHVGPAPCAERGPASTVGARGGMTCGRKSAYYAVRRSDEQQQATSVRHLLTPLFPFWVLWPSSSPLAGEEFSRECSFITRNTTLYDWLYPPRGAEPAAQKGGGPSLKVGPCGPSPPGPIFSQTKLEASVQCTNPYLCPAPARARGSFCTQPYLALGRRHR